MPTVKILIVTDAGGGFQRSTQAAHKFHLGEFVQVLRDTSWEGFSLEITTAHRDDDPSPATAAAVHAIGADLYGFRFTAAALAPFDMAFFFSIATPGEDPATDAERQTEAAAVAAFMEAGKGFFAAGDHEDLGAGVNQHIPRVRSMRRWAKIAPGPHGGLQAPGGVDATRHDTLQAGSDTVTDNGMSYAYQFNDQSDAIPQPIHPKIYTQFWARIAQSTVPHPLLCSPLGRIEVLPDHMHEGWCEVPDDLTADEGLPGRTGKKEYPVDGSGQTVAPEVIAQATVLAHATLNQEFSGPVHLSPMTTKRDFGVIGAYDGHLAGIGRVVVDATWHHFVNINVIGTNSMFAGTNPDKAKGFYSGPSDAAVPAYRRIQWYYRNLVYWLIPANRMGPIFASQVGRAVHLHPRWEEFAGKADEVHLRNIIGFAQLAREYLDRARGHCVKWQITKFLLYPLDRWINIWELIGPEVDPWGPIKGGRANDPLPAWRQAFLPDPGLRATVLLGAVAMAAARHVRVHGEVTEREYEAVQRGVLELLPRALQLAAHEAKAALEHAHRMSAELGELAAGVAKAVER